METANCTVKILRPTSCTTSLGSNGKVVVLKNGNALTYKDSDDPDATEFTFDAGTIILAANQVNVGDIFTITVEAGNAPKETYTAHIGGIYYPSPTGSVKKDAGSYTIPEATLVGYGTIAYEKKTEGDGIVSGFDTTTRVATLANSGIGNVEFEATLTPTSKTGWHYLSDTPTATFTLTVNN